MPTYEERVAALEKDAATMRRDIIYKLDDTNSAVTAIKGIVGNQGQDIRDIKNNVRDIKSDVSDIRSDVRTANVRLEGVSTRLEGLKEEVRTIKQQQDEQRQDITDIKRNLNALDEKFGQRFTSLEGKFDQVLQQLTLLTKKSE